MFQIRKILFPVDFSEACIGAARYVEAFAGRFQAELTLLHVVDIGSYATWGLTAEGGIPVIELSREGAKQGRQKLDGFLVTELKHLDVKRQVIEGDPGIEIVAAARQSGCDLIMMPTQGLSVFRRYLIGSITAKILHDAECPIWTGPHLEKAPPLEAISFHKVLCAVDLGPQSASALRWAAGFAAEHSAELIVAHAVPAAEFRPATYFDHGFVEVVVAQARKELKDLLESLGIAARIVMVGGNPAKEICKLAQTEQVDQLVIARGAVAEGLGRLRTQSYAMIQGSPRPVISV